MEVLPKLANKSRTYWNFCIISMKIGKKWDIFPNIRKPEIVGSTSKVSQVDMKVSAKWRGRVLKCRRYSSVFTVA